MKNMTPEQREAHARDMLANPLFVLLSEKMEQDAINRAVNASLTDSLAQQAALAEVRAVRTFRRNCEAMLRNTQGPKAAPA